MIRVFLAFAACLCLAGCDPNDHIDVPPPVEPTETPVETPPPVETIY